jgi:hypothetical protein
MHIVLKIALVSSALSALSACNQATMNTRPSETAPNLNAVMSDSVKSYKTQAVIPGDPKMKSVIDAAMPNIKKVLGLHQCMRYDSKHAGLSAQNLRQLNKYGVVGVDFSKRTGYIPAFLPMGLMEHHLSSSCVVVQALDTWTMPALNALSFRAVYLAEDSGETQNFTYLFKQVESGEWRLQEFK